jgi:hypothetical protein
MVVYLEGQYLQKVDWQSIAEASKLNGVISGLEVTIVSGLTVRVGTGIAYINSNYINKSSTTDVTLDVADSKPRKDLIVINDAGTISKVKGTAADIYPDPDKSRTLTPIPRPPELPANSILLAEVWVGANATSLVADDIADKRQFVKPEFRIEPRTSDPTGSALFDGRTWIRTDL